MINIYIRIGNIIHIQIQLHALHMLPLLYGLGITNTCVSVSTSSLRRSFNMITIDCNLFSVSIYKYRENIYEEKVR